MPAYRQINKTESVLNHLKRYGSIDRRTAANLFNLYNLPQTIKRIKRKGYKVSQIEGYEPNTKYVMDKL